MSASQILEDGSRLSRLDRGLNRLEAGLTLFAGLLILATLVFSFINIVGRGVFNSPFNAYFDLVGQSVPLIAFLGLAYCQRVGGHIRMDLFLGRLRGRPLWFAEGLGTVLTLVVILLIGWGAYLAAERAFEKGDSTEDIRLVLWPLKTLIVAMLGLMALRLGLQAWGYFRLMIWGGTPVAVPLIETPAQQAASEAQAVGTPSHEGESREGETHESETHESGG